MEGSRESAQALILRRMKAAGMDTAAVQSLFAVNEVVGADREDSDAAEAPVQVGAARETVAPVP